MTINANPHLSLFPGARYVALAEAGNFDMVSGVPQERTLRFLNSRSVVDLSDQEQVYTEPQQNREQHRGVWPLTLDEISRALVILHDDRASANALTVDFGFSRNLTNTVYPPLLSGLVSGGEPGAGVRGATVYEIDNPFPADFMKAGGFGGGSTAIDDGFYGQIRFNPQLTDGDWDISAVCLLIAGKRANAGTPPRGFINSHPRFR